MPIDWKAFEEEAREAAKTAAKETDDDLASVVSSITRLTTDEIKEICPTNTDVEKLARLLTIVKSAESSNTKVNKLVGNVQELAGIAIRLINKLA